MENAAAARKRGKKETKPANEKKWGGREGESQGSGRRKKARRIRKQSTGWGGGRRDERSTQEQQIGNESNRRRDKKEAKADKKEPGGVSWTDAHESQGGNQPERTKAMASESGRATRLDGSRGDGHCTEQADGRTQAERELAAGGKMEQTNAQQTDRGRPEQKKEEGPEAPYRAGQTPRRSAREEPARVQQTSSETHEPTDAEIRGAKEGQDESKTCAAPTLTQARKVRAPPARTRPGPERPSRARPPPQPPRRQYRKRRGTREVNRTPRPTAQKTRTGPSRGSTRI